MGIQHLRIIQEQFQKNPDKLFGKTEIRDDLGINYWAVLDVLDYLLHENKIKKVGTKYQWRQK